MPNDGLSFQAVFYACHLLASMVATCSLICNAKAMTPMWLLVTDRRALPG
jgi:hypothetical protein